MKKFNQIKLAILQAIVMAAVMGGLGFLATAKIALAVNSAPSDSQEATIKQILIETGAEFGWNLGDCVTETPTYEGAEPKRHCNELVGPRALLESQGGEYVTKAGVAHYWLEVPTLSGGTVWEEGPLRIMAYTTETAAEATITESISLSKSLAGFEATTFHNHPAIISSISTLGGKTTEWQSGRFYFMAGNSIATEISSEELAEALYANAVKYGLVVEGEETISAQDSDGDGVTDNIDQCPDTSSGVTVDASGCPLTEMSLTLATDKKIYAPKEIVVIQGRVSSITGGLAGAVISLEVSSEQYSATASATASSTGDYRLEFPIPSNVTEAKYTVSATVSYSSYPSVSKSTSFVVGTMSMQLEENTATKEPFIGVVADGVNSLSISISLPGCSEGCSDVKVSKPDIGKLEGDAIDAGGNVTLDSTGAAEITYYPPDYLTKDQLTQNLEVHQSGSKAWAAKVPLTLTYTDANEQAGQMAAEILVCRPPIMLVHGFLGALETWEKMSIYLRGEKFDTYSGNYGATDQSIEGLSLVLKQDVQKQKVDYANANIKLTKVDLVGHSMGGLISRHYSHGLAGYAGDARKIIMVGTPNHGVSWSKKVAGNVGAGWSQTHQLPAEQLYSESPFMQTLNSGEKNGAQLNSDIQYGNIYGWPDDWVVSAASAYLNGIKGVSLSSVKHSPAIPGIPMVAITEYLTVWEQVNSWLTSDIYRPSLQGSQVEVFKYSGDVFLINYDSTGSHESKLASVPTKFDSWQSLRTGKDSTAIIHLKIDEVAWGVIFLDPDSEIFLGYISPQLVEVRLWTGSAAFRSKQDGHFTVPVNIKKSENGEWWKYSPKAVITGRSTEFAVAAGENIEVHCLEGELVVDTPEAAEEGTILAANESVSVKGESITPINPPAKNDFWWSAEDDGFLDSASEDNWLDKFQSFIEKIQQVRFNKAELTSLGQGIKSSSTALITFIVAGVLLLFFIVIAVLKFAKKKIGSGILLLTLGLILFCLFGAVVWFLTLDDVSSAETNINSSTIDNKAAVTNENNNSNTNSAVKNTNITAKTNSNTNAITNTNTTANKNTNLTTTNNANENVNTNTNTAIKPSTVAVADYGFTLEVGAEHADKIRPVAIDPGSFAQASYVFCFDTAEPNEEVIYCEPGEAMIFEVNIMTPAQWSETAASDYGDAYLSMAERNNLFYIFSHPNGVLPSDAPATEDFYNQVRDSIEFAK